MDPLPVFTGNMDNIVHLFLHPPKAQIVHNQRISLKIKAVRLLVRARQNDLCSYQISSVHSVFDEDNVEGSEVSQCFQLIKTVVAVEKTILLVIFDMVVGTFENTLKGRELVVPNDFDTELAICGLHEESARSQALFSM